MNHTCYFYCCFLLPLIVAGGSGQIECTATEEGLTCKFSENVNSTQRDFSIYFDPDHGSEEQLVACSWVKSQLYCITQKGFELEGLVSETAVITIPTSFVSRNGSYRCENDGYPFNATSCRVPAKRDVKHFAACEANSIFAGNQLSLQCNFPFAVESFSVIYNTSVFAKYTISSCKEIYPICKYKAEEGKTAFTVTLNTTKYLYGEFACHPDNFPDILEVKGCAVAIDIHIADSSAFSWKVLTAFCTILLVLSTVMVVGCVLLRKRKKGKEENRRINERLSETSSWGHWHRRSSASDT